MRVVEEVAAATGVDPVDLDEPLSDVVDPDALDALFSGRHPEDGTAGGYTSFVYHGCRVTVDADGFVSVTVLAE
jgi:hypothetical protein